MRVPEALLYSSVGLLALGGALALVNGLSATPAALLTAGFCLLFMRLLHGDRTAAFIFLAGTACAGALYFIYIAK